MPDWAIGEQAVPPAYRAVSVPTYLQTIRTQLFGTAPDRSFLNYRLAQYMALLSATELQQYVLKFDPRITYKNADLSALYNASAFTPLTTGPLGLAVIGTPGAPDPSGQMYYNFDITVTSSNTVKVHQNNPSAQDWIYNYTVSGSYANPLPLGDSGYSFIMPEQPSRYVSTYFSPGYWHSPYWLAPNWLPQDMTGSDWNVSFNLRPQWDCGQILVSLHNCGEPTLIQLFGDAPAQPMLTYDNLFDLNPELPYALGGILLATATQTNNLLAGSN